MTNNINLTNKQQCFQLQKLMEEILLHDDLIIYGVVGYDIKTKIMEVVLEEIPSMDSDKCLSVYVDIDGDIGYMILDQEGNETTFGSYEELLLAE